MDTVESSHSHAVQTKSQHDSLPPGPLRRTVHSVGCAHCACKVPDSLLLPWMQEEEFYCITWEAKKEVVFELPTGGAAIMRQVTVWQLCLTLCGCKLCTAW